MARATEPSLTDVLDRWAEQHVLAVDTEMHSDGGTYGASMEVCSQTGKIDLVVTGVHVEHGSIDDHTTEVSKAFAQLISAPADAALLAAEVHRLRAKVQELRERER